MDNSQAKSFVEGTCVHSRLRGNFDLREKWVVELKAAKDIEILQISGVNNCADLLTKPHKTTRFQQLLSLIGSKPMHKYANSLSMAAWIHVGRI